MICTVLLYKDRLYAGWALRGREVQVMTVGSSAAPLTASTLLRHFIWQCFPLPASSFTSSRCTRKQAALHQRNLTQMEQNTIRPWEPLLRDRTSAEVFGAASFSSLSALPVRFLAFDQPQDLWNWHKAFAYALFWLPKFVNPLKLHLSETNSIGITKTFIWGSCKFSKSKWYCTFSSL